MIIPQWLKGILLWRRQLASAEYYGRHAEPVTGVPS